MKVYIIQNNNEEIIGATLSKEVAKEMIKECAYTNYEKVYEQYVDDNCKDIDAKVKSKINEVADHLVNGPSNYLGSDNYCAWSSLMNVWCNIVELSE